MDHQGFTLCQNCHQEAPQGLVGEGSVTRFDHSVTKAGNRECSQCHDPKSPNLGITWAGAKFPHNDPVSACSTCHESERPRDTQNWYAQFAFSSAPFDYTSHGQGTDCSACHGSANRTDSFRDWSDGNFDHILVKSQFSGGSCADCHESQRPKPGVLFGTFDHGRYKNDDCIGCHTSDFSSYQSTYPTMADWRVRQEFSFRPLIVGGTEVTSNDPIAKSTVLIVGKINRASFICTGSILTQDLVLTAGHCLGQGGWAELTVYFRTTANGEGPSAKVIRQVRIHDTLLTTPMDQDDLAILKLQSNIPQGFLPIEFLQDPSLLKDGTKVTLAGYGKTNPDPDQLNGLGTLRKVEQTVLQAQYGQKEILVNIRDRGSCNGDSGGPAFIQNDGQLLLLGVTSRLTERDQLPDVNHHKRYACTVDMIYSNVMKQREWIDGQVRALDGAR